MAINASFDPTLNPEEAAKQQNPWLALQQAFPQYPQQAPDPLMSVYSPMTQPTINAGNMAAPAQQPPQPDMFGAGGSSSSTRPANMDAMNKLLAEMNQKNISGMGDQADVIQKLKDAAAKMPSGPAGMDWSPLMAYADSINPGSKLMAGYKAPETGAERAKAQVDAQLQIAKASGALTNDQLALLRDRLMGEKDKLQYGMFKDQMNSQRASDQEEKDAQALMKFMDTERTGGRFTAIGKAQGNVFQAQRIKQLIDQYAQDPNSMPLTGPSSLSEIAIGLNSLLSATGGSEESRKSLIPASAKGKFSTLQQFIMNKPMGAEGEAFVKNASDTLGRELATNQKQIDAYKNRIAQATSGGRLAKLNPSRYHGIIDAYITPQEPQAPSAQGPQVGEIIEGHKFLGGDPSKASSWGEVR